MKTSLNGITGRLGKLSYGTTLRPTRDWLMLLAIVLVLMLASIAWNLWTFKKVTEGEPLDTGATAVAPETDMTDEVRRLFEERAAEEARYRSEYRFVDPSSAAR